MNEVEYFDNLSILNKLPPNILQKEGPNVSNPLEDETRLPQIVVEYTLMSILIASGTVGNVCIIYKFGFTERRHNAGSALVVALAVNDFLSSILMPMDALIWIYLSAKYSGEDYQLYPYPLGKGMCYILQSVSHMFMMASSWLMAAISIERLRYK